MTEKICHHCRRPWALRRPLSEHGPGQLICRACVQDIINGKPEGYTAAKRGELCHGPGVVRLVHARRRDAAAEVQRRLREDLAHGN